MDQRLTGRVMELLQSNDVYKDLNIRCKDTTHRVHRAIVCPQSEFFAKACTGEFRSQESQTHEIVLEEDDPEAVEKMLMYFYTQTYDAGPGPGEHTETTRSHDPFIDIHVNVIADKYGVTELKTLTEESFHKWAADNWGQEEFARAAFQVCQLEHQNALRHAIVDAITTNRQTLLEEEEIINLLQSFGELTLQILRRIMEIEAESNEKQLATENKLKLEIDAVKRSAKKCNSELSYIKMRLGSIQIDLDEAK